MQVPIIQIAPMQWAHLPDIAEVQQISNEDHQVLDDIRGVLLKHGAIGRFGIHLLHKHFEVAADEVLVEYTDVKERTLHCKVEKRKSGTPGDHNRIETMWSYVGDGATRVCDQQCVYNNGHANRHYRRPGIVG